MTFTSHSRWFVRKSSGPRVRSHRKREIERFDVDALHHTNVEELVRLTLASRGVTQVIELREDDHLNRRVPIEELELEGYGIWTDETAAWLVGLDHDFGSGLFGDLKDVWPDWRRWRSRP